MTYGPIRTAEDIPARQREILAGLVVGKQDKQLAAELNLSLSSVKTHKGVLYRRLGVINRAQAAVAGYRLLILGEPHGYPEIGAKDPRRLRAQKEPC